jgi:hypothetical protein
VADREPHVGDAHFQEAAAGVPGAAEFLREHAVSLRGDRGEQPSLVPEVIRRRRVADPARRAASRRLMAAGPACAIVSTAARSSAGRRSP